MFKSFNIIGVFLLILILIGCKNDEKKDRVSVAKEAAQKLKSKRERIKEKDTAAIASNTRGEAIYEQNCAVCHQANGGGVPNLNPPLEDADYTLGEKEPLIELLLQGSSDKRIEVNGKTYSNVMPSFKSLEDKQIADVLTYIRNSFGNDASTVTAEEVTKIRSELQ